MQKLIATEYVDLPTRVALCLASTSLYRSSFDRNMRGKMFPIVCAQFGYVGLLRWSVESLGCPFIVQEALDTILEKMPENRVSLELLLFFYDHTAEWDGTEGKLQLKT